MYKENRINVPKFFRTDFSRHFSDSSFKSLSFKFCLIIFLLFYIPKMISWHCLLVFQTLKMSGIHNRSFPGSVLLCSQNHFFAYSQMWHFRKCTP